MTVVKGRESRNLGLASETWLRSCFRPLLVIVLRDYVCRHEAVERFEQTNLETGCAIGHIRRFGRYPYVRFKSSFTLHVTKSITFWKVAPSYISRQLFKAISKAMLLVLLRNFSMFTQSGAVTISWVRSKSSVIEESLKTCRSFDSISAVRSTFENSFP